MAEGADNSADQAVESRLSRPTDAAMADTASQVYRDGDYQSVFRASQAGSAEASASMSQGQNAIVGNLQLTDSGGSNNPAEGYEQSSRLPGAAPGGYDGDRKYDGPPVASPEQIPASASAGMDPGGHSFRPADASAGPSPQAAQGGYDRGTQPGDPMGAAPEFAQPNASLGTAQGHDARPNAPEAVSALSPGPAAAGAMQPDALGGGGSTEVSTETAAIQARQRAEEQARSLPLPPVGDPSAAASSIGRPQPAADVNAIGSPPTPASTELSSPHAQAPNAAVGGGNGDGRDGGRVNTGGDGGGRHNGGGDSGGNGGGNGSGDGGGDDGSGDRGDRPSKKAESVPLEDPSLSEQSRAAYAESVVRNNGDLPNAYAGASALEDSRGVNREQARTDTFKNDLKDKFLNPDEQAFDTFVKDNPLKAYTLAHALRLDQEKSAASADGGTGKEPKTPLQEMIDRRSKQTIELTEPLVKDDIAQKLRWHDNDKTETDYNDIIQEQRRVNSDEPKFESDRSSFLEFARTLPDFGHQDLTEQRRHERAIADFKDARDKDVIQDPAKQLYPDGRYALNDIYQGYKSTDTQAKEEAGDKYLHASGKVFLDDAYKQQISPEQLSRYFDQLPQTKDSIDYHFAKSHGIESYAGTPEELEYTGGNYGGHVRSREDRSSSARPYTSLAEVRAGEIKPDASGLDPKLTEVLKHEWMHGFTHNNRELTNAYKGAAKVEPNTTPGTQFRRDYAASSGEENFAVHASEEFLSPDKSKFDRFVEQAPLKAYTMATAFQSRFADTDGAHKSSGQKLLESRVAETIKLTEEKAMQAMKPEMVGWEQKKADPEFVARLEAEKSFAHHVDKPATEEYALKEMFARKFAERQAREASSNKTDSGTFDASPPTTGYFRQLIGKLPKW